MAEGTGLPTDDNRVMTGGDLVFQDKFISMETSEQEEAGGQRSLPRGGGRPFLAAGVFLTLLAFLLVATNGWLAWRSYEQAWSQSARTTKNLGHSVANQLDSLFSEVDRVLNTLGYMLEQGEMAPATLQALQPLMVTHLGSAEYLHGLFVYSDDGSWLVHTQPIQPSHANNSDREYFVRHRESRSTRVLISKPVESRSTGDWIIPVSKRIDDANGGFAGVVLATVRVDQVLKMLNGFDIGAKGAISLSLADGTIVVRRPYSIGDLGRVIPNNPLLAAAQKERAGMIKLASPIDGIERLVVFEHLPNNPLYVAVALSEDEILSTWRSASQLQLACVLLLISVIGLSGHYVIRSMKVRRQADRVLRSVHEQIMQKNAQLANLAEHDGMTGILNRRAFDQRFLEMFGQSRRYGRPFSVILLDVDHFKAYNDHYGHLAGDECLRRVAAALSTAMRRPADVLARYGGEEFVAILPDTDEAGAWEVANVARVQVERLMLPHAVNDKGVVTISSGVACANWNEPDLSTDTLLNKADKALYQAKSEGRNRVVIAHA